jgi:hypothetical protein
LNDQPRIEGFVAEPAAPQAAPEPPKPTSYRQAATGAPPVVEKPKPRVELPPPQLEPSPAESDRPTIIPETWPIKVKLLYKPIANDKGQMVDELSFREPRGGDINRYGNPCRIAQDGEILMDERKMTWIMSALCGVLVPMLELMDPRDWNSCAYRLRSFFLPDTRAW